MRRAAAALGAVAIIVVAVVVRGLIDGGDDDPGPGPDSNGEVVVVCDTDFEAQCEGLTGVEVRVEDSATTSAAIVAGELDDVDGWVTTDTWYELTAGRARERTGSAERLATTPVVVATDPNRFDAVSELCADVAVWTCLLQNAGKNWGDLGAGDPAWRELKVGLPSADTAVGLSVLTSVAAGHFGGLDFASNDFDSLRTRLSVLAEPSGSGDRQLLVSLLRRAGTYSAAGVTAAGAERARPSPGVIPVTPAVNATGVLVDLPAGDPLPGVDSLRDVFAESGWSVATGDPGSLLNPGVMGALHDLWRAVTG